MTITDFITKIENEYDDLTPGIIKPESKFRDVFEWNSINALILIAMVKTEYGVLIDADDIQKSQTINDLFTIIKSRA